MMASNLRDLEVLLVIVGAVDGLPLREVQIAEAYQAGAISAAEGKLLQRHARLSPRGRKAAAMQPRDVSDAAVQRMKAKLSERMAELESMRRRLDRGDGVR